MSLHWEILHTTVSKQASLLVNRSIQLSTGSRPMTVLSLSNALHYEALEGPAYESSDTDSI